MVPAVLSLLAALALVLVLAGVYGCALWRLAGPRDPSPVVVPLGFAALIVLAGLGDWVAVGAGALAALIYLARRPLAMSLWTLGTAVGVSALALLPFVSAGRVGLLGTGVNDDMAEHLLAAWSLQGHGGVNKLVSTGYPVGPHAVAEALSSATGLSLEATFTALLVAAPVCIALGAAAIVPGRPLWRGVAGALCGLCYLQAAYLTQASFKEPMEAVVLVAIVAVVPALSSRPLPSLRYLPLGVLLAATVYINSYLGLVWPAAALVLWVAARRPRIRPELPAAALGAATFLALAGPEIPRMVRFAHSAYNREGASVLGNLFGRMPLLEVTGVWPRPDFRFSLPFGSPGGVLALVAVGALLIAVVSSVRRRELGLPAALVGAAAVVGATAWRSPYTEAKALVVAAP